MKKLIVILLFLWIPSAFALTKINVDSNDNDKVDGEAEVYSSSWNADVDAPQKNDLYDYLVNFDTDADGSFADEAWLTGAYQPLDADLTSVAALTTSAYGLALIEVANETIFKALVNLEAGTDFYSVAGADAAFEPLDAAIVKSNVSQTITKTWYFDDGVTNSPPLVFKDGTDEYWYLYKADASDFNIYISNGSDRNVSIANVGAGNANLLVDGTISEGGSLLSALYEGLLTNSAGLAAALSDETGTGAVVLAADPAFTGFPTTPAAAPDADYEVANKKYVDDNVGSGDVVGPGSATDNAVAVFDSTTGKLIKENTNFVIGTNGVVNSSDNPTANGYHNTDAEIVWSLGVVDADVNTATGDTTSRWKTRVADSDTLENFASANGTNETFEANKPFEPQMGIGTIIELISADDSIDADVCEAVFVQSTSVAANTTSTLPAIGDCAGVAGYAKRFTFIARSGDADDFIIDVNGGTDLLRINDANCSAGATVTCDSGEYMDVYGMEITGTTYWFGKGTCDCTP